MNKPVFNKTVLDNGIRVLTEAHPATRCVVVGFWLDRGTRDEPHKLMGVSHLIEHLVFKGTQKLNSLEIAKKIEAVGGEINAFTSKEHTCFHTTTLKEDLELSIDILSQLFCEAQFSKEDFEKEKNVVVQEILMSKDDIEDSVFESYFIEAYKDNSLGWPILGQPKILDKITRKDVMNWYAEAYLPENLIVSVAGAIDHKNVVQLVEKYLSHLQRQHRPEQRQTPKWSTWKKFSTRESEQTHVVMGLPTLPYSAEERFDAFVFNACLGGGMTSRLYQTVREDKGWAYSIFSMLNTFGDCGALMIYAATDKKLYRKVIEAIYKDLEHLKKNKISSSEVEFYKKQVRGQLLIAAEDIDSRMHSLAINEMVFGKYRSVESVIQEMDKVTTTSVEKYIKDWVNPENMNLYMMGDLDKSKTKKWLEGL
ncbi:MAG: insulinase family protein [Bdellovibrionales bacterium]|nr:insulinase family protein [Bdellovibrionales bacterium]